MSMKRMAMTGLMAASLAASAIALPFIKDWEGRELVAYQDTGGVWTICDGDTIGVQPGDTSTHRECDARTLERVTQFAKAVDQAVIPVIPEKTHAAFTSFAYNIGMGNFITSTARRYLNSGKTMAACEQIMRWVYVKGRDCRVRANRCSGIVKRRAAERALCLEGLGVPV